MRRTVTASLALLFTLALLPPAAADDIIPIPNGFQPEGIAVADDGTFYVGSTVDGSIYSGDVSTGAGEILVTPPAGRTAVGLWYDEPTGWLVVAGGPLGTAYVYDTATGASLAAYDLGGAFVNDVVATRDAIYLTDSMMPLLHVIPFDEGRTLPGPDAVTTLPLGGDYVFVDGAFNANGIEMAPHGDLIVANSATGTLYLVDPGTGEASAIDLGGATVPNADGILLQGRSLFVVQNFLNQISAIRLGPGLASGYVGSVIASDAFRIPTTVGGLGRDLYAVNARFDVAPPFGDPVPDVEFEIVRTLRRGD